VEILKNLSPDMPAAIVIVLHMALGSSYDLKDTLGRFSRLPLVVVENREALQQGFIFVPPPGRTAICSPGMITVEHSIPDRLTITINRLFSHRRPRATASA
jgi:two-component system, chemotaxis family, protein-glutamate methylesterase/glutaminase